MPRAPKRGGNPKQAHERNKAHLQRLQESVKAPFSSARITFHIVPWGWQADIELTPEGGKMESGSVCRDFGDSHGEAKAMLDKLFEIAKSGKP